MGLALEGVALDNVLVDLIAVLAGSLASDADTTVDVQRALKRLVGLETDDGLLLAVGVIDVASGVAHDTRDGLGVHIEDTACSRSLSSRSRTSPHSSLVRSVGPARNDSSPS